MFKKALIWASLATCMAISVIAWGTADSTVVTVNAEVDTIVEWDDGTPYAVDIGTHITAVGQSQTGTKTMALRSNAANGCSITVAGTLNGGILTEAGGDVLTTEYVINGTGVKAADRDGGTYLSTAAFFAKSYEVPFVTLQGTYEVIIGAKATAPSTRAPNAGAYTCTVTLTATSL